MLFALAEPLSALGLVVAFLLGVGVRAAAQEPLARRLTGSTRYGAVWPVPRRDVDPFGAVAAALGGTGWGRAAPLAGPVVATRAAILGRVVVHLAGPLGPVLLGEAVLAGYTAAYPGAIGTALYRPSDVLRGIPGPPGQQFLLSVGVGLLCFGVLALVPLPPCDGAGLLWLAWRRPGPRARTVRYWLTDRNIGVLVLLLAMVPIGARGALLYPLFDAVGTPLVRSW